MKFDIKIPLLDQKELEVVFLWLESEIGIEGDDWTWDVKWSPGYDHFEFVTDEDKVKFILRWL